MKPEEAIARLKGMQNKKVDYAEMVCAPAFCSGYEYVYPEPEDYAIEEAIKALKEIQNYRKLGTLEELARAKKYINLAKKHGTIGEMIDECAEYEAIGTIEQVRNQKANLNTAYKIISDYESCGTVEECREAREKQIPKKPVCKPKPYNESVGFNEEWFCPSCGAYIGYFYEGMDEPEQMEYCNECGQHIARDWSDENEDE